MGVLPAYRRRNIATKLITEALQHGRRRECAAAALHVLEDNDSAFSLYKSNGFRYMEPIVRVADFSEPDEDGKRRAADLLANFSLS